MEKNTEKIWLDIHSAIHNKEKTGVRISGIAYFIIVSKTGCRELEWNNMRFIEQNKKKDSKYARDAINGDTITWVIRQGSWGLIRNGKVERE